MKTDNLALMKMARESLSGQWTLAVVTYLVYLILYNVLLNIPYVGPVAIFVSAGPFFLGFAIFSLFISRGGEAELAHILAGFKNFGPALVAYVLICVYTFLWMLLLIVPGIIAALSYSMTFYIMAEDESISPMEAIEKSKEMMEGYKWKLFGLWMIFFGLALLCIPTFGIGLLWLGPYIYVTLAKFYDDVSGSYEDAAYEIEPSSYSFGQ